MPVDLPDTSTNEQTPSPPKLIVWLSALVVAVTVNLTWTLLSWPKDESTTSVWFWSRLLVFPIVGWGAAFGLRLFYYDEEMSRLAAEKDTLEGYRAKAVEFAQEPLAVLGSSYLTAIDAGSEGVASAIAQKTRMLKSTIAHSGEKPLRHTSLSLYDDASASDRYRSAFVQLLAGIKESLDELPVDVPFEIYLQLPAEIDRAQMVQTWKACWHDCGYSNASVQLLESETGLMALDAWLDVNGGPGLERFALFVAVQLHDAPPENSAEAAAALLFGWAPLAERRGLKPIVLLHRPVQSENIDFIKSLPKALLWGRTIVTQLNDVWQAGLTSEDKTAFLKKSGELGLQASKTEDFAGIHDIDRALGNPGTAAAWLSIALASEHAWRTIEPQLVLARENSLWLAVVQPLVNGYQTECINEGA
jgi:hypothetical protein